MVYKEDFIAVIKNKGKILREHGGIVRLPFGSEYSISMKNKNSMRALVNVEVDGKDVLDGHGLIFNPNEEFTLKGFMKGNRVTNKFKFINKTKQISDHRGDRLDDGIVRVEFSFEKADDILTGLMWYSDPTPQRYNGGYGLDYSATHYYNDSGLTGSSSSGLVGNSTISCSNNIKMKSGPKKDEGITVKGSQTIQNFVSGNIGELGSSSAINIQLRGYKQNGKVVQLPVTTKTKLICPTCGKKSKSSAKFCSRCSTFLD